MGVGRGLELEWMGTRPNGMREGRAYSNPIDISRIHTFSIYYQGRMPNEINLVIHSINFSSNILIFSDSL